MKKFIIVKCEKKEMGITMIALVITIIILLLLAGITIANLNGENGLLSKAKQSKEKYSIAEAKEKLELAITNLQIEQEGKGEQLTKEVLPNINNKEIDIRSVNDFPIEAICNNYKFYIKSDFTVEYVGEANETIVTYTTEPEGYTNKDKIKVLITISNPKGIKSMQYPNDNDLLLTNGQKKVGIDYDVTANGTYTFKIVDVDGKEISKDIVIDKIDKVAPKDFTISIEKKTDNGFVISANADDGDKTDSNCKSGIDHYEYYVVDVNGNEVKYNTNEITDLVTGDYKIYVIVYDKAGNFKKSKVVESNFVKRYMWNLGVQNSEMTVASGTPVYKGNEEGVYLENASLKMNHKLNSKYTLLIETKDIVLNSTIYAQYGMIAGYGYGNAGVGSTALGIFEFSNKYLGAMSGSGDSMTVYGNFNDWYIPGQWNILAIRYNGKEFSFWINGEKKGFSSSSTLKGDILYIGGFSNAGTSSAGVNWGYADGYYRNLAIYDGALSDEELTNYEF